MENVKVVLKAFCFAEYKTKQERVFRLAFCLKVINK